MGYPTQETANRFGGHLAGGIATANPSRMTIASALGGLDAVLQRTLDYTQRLEVIVERICGTQPTQTGSDKTATIPTHLPSQIEARRDLLAAVMNRVEKALVEIEETL